VLGKRGKSEQDGNRTEEIVDTGWHEGELYDGRVASCWCRRDGTADPPRLRCEG
jgi:hypothetical protein